MAHEAATSGVKVLGDNRKARYHYEIEETMECGIALQGTEVKSIRSGKFSFSDAYGRIRDGELWLIGLHVTPWPFGGVFNHEPERDRKLLVKKKELKFLKRKVDEKGFTLIPMQFYLKNGLIKVALGVGRGKKLYDKRESIKKREQSREVERDFKSRI